MVDLALSSMALAVFSQTHRHEPAAIQATNRYHSLLLTLQKRIGLFETRLTDEADVDACLLVIFIMARYETVLFRANHLVSPNAFALMQNWSHHDGAMAVLKTWLQQSDHKPASFIVKHNRRGLLKSALLRNLPLPDWILDGSRFGESGMELGYDRIFVRTINTHYGLTSLPLDSSSSTAEAERLYYDAQSLTEDLEDWVAQFPNEWSIQRHSLENSGTWPRKHFYAPMFYSFQKLGYGVAWSLYFAARMLISSIRLRLLGLFRQDTQPSLSQRAQWLESADDIEKAADGLAATVPICIGRVKVVNDRVPECIEPTFELATDQILEPHLAHLLIWTLTIASSVAGMQPKQQAWFRTELAELGRSIGSSILECAETDRWGTL
ncbi:MAG: hypothetical protein Q9218_004651 [Villophora microphyllina]